MDRVLNVRLGLHLLLLKRTFSRLETRHDRFFMSDWDDG